MLNAPMLMMTLLVPTTFDDAPEIPLWPGGAPGFESRKDEPTQAKDYWVKNIHNPSITVFLPPKDKANGASMVICPGGAIASWSSKPKGSTLRNTSTASASRRSCSNTGWVASQIRPICLLKNTPGRTADGP